MRFSSINEIDKNIVLHYIKEAIENQKSGKEIKADRTKKETVIPIELQEVLNNNANLVKYY